MTIEEIVSKYKGAIKEAKNTFVADFRQFLKANELDGKVVRIDDGKVGWLDVDYDLRINFYPMKKNGERSLNSSGWFCNSDIPNDFKPFKGEDV